MKTVIVANQKGGVAKTTTCGAVASLLSRKGYKVLAIDSDPQATLTDNVGGKQSKQGVYNVLRKKTGIVECIQHLAHFDLLPATIQMAALEAELMAIPGKEYLLKRAIEREELSKIYDFIIIDTPPALGVMTVGALTTGDYVIIPIQGDVNAVKGIAQLHSTIESVKEYLNPHLKIAGILQTRHNKQYNINKEVLKLAERTAEEFNCSLFPTRIRTCVSAPESNFSRIDLFEYDPSSTVAQDYTAFVDELLEEVR